MKSTKYTLSALATAAAVAFGGVAIAQVSSGDTPAGMSASADTELSTGNTLSNNDTNMNGSNASAGSVDTQTMGAGGSGLSADANADLNSDTNMNSDMESDDLLAPRADRG